ncbi:methyltransferase domain-containing protein [soil metagenome]
MIADVVDLLECPHCHLGLTLFDRAARCANGHTFDVARHGYLNLLPGDAHTGTADTAPMVVARDVVLEGPFAPLVGHVADSVGLMALPEDGCVLDLGAGTGRYLAAVLDTLPDRHGLALDLSKHAARRAARAHPRLGAVVCDAWGRLPVREGVAALALSIFAPRNAAELARVLAPDGALLVVTPTPRHLSPLVRELGLLTVDARKDQRLERSLAGWFTLADRHRCAYGRTMDAEDIAAVVTMGPSTRHIEPGVLAERIAALAAPLPVTVGVVVSRYRPDVLS